MANTKINRSAKTGKIVSAATAKRKPRTTVTETVTGYERHKKEVVRFLEDLADPASHPFMTLTKAQSEASRILKKIK